MSKFMMASRLPDPGMAVSCQHGRGMEKKQRGWGVGLVTEENRSGELEDKV
jgi:hypothetical protein